MADKPEIGAKFTLDDAASKTLENIKKGFGAVSDKADQVKAAFFDMAKTAIGTAIGVNLGGGIAALSDLGRKALEAGNALYAAEKNAIFLQGGFAKAGTSFNDLQVKARGFVQEMKTLERQTGITGATLSESFATLADKMNPARATITQAGTSVLRPLNWIEKGLQRSEDQIKQLMTNIGYAGRLMAGGPDALAKSFTNFSAAGAKASDPIVQLIATTGTLKGNAQQVAAQLRMLTDASALSFAQAAIEKLAQKGKAAPPDFQTTVNQLTALRDQFITQFGAPISKAVIPVLERFRTTIEQNKDKIEAFAKMMGDKVGKYVTEAGVKMQEGFKYILNHGKEIADALEKAAQTVGKVFKFILDHKEEIALAFGAKAVAPVVGGAMSMARGALPAATFLGQTAIPGMAGGSLLEKAGTSAHAGAIAMGAFVTALVAFTVAADQAAKLVKENSAKGKFGEKAKDQEAREDYFKRVAKSIEEQDRGGFEKVKQRYVETAKALGESGEKAAEFAESQWKMHEVMTEMAGKADQAKAFLEGGKGTALRLATDVPTQMDALSNAYVEQIVTMYNQAVKTQNTAAAQYAANVIAGSSAVQHALINAKVGLEGGFDSLATVLGEKGADVAQKLKNLMEEASGKGVTPTKPVVQFNNNTFNLKQDFRDQDPDRVALVFRNDIMKAAENRRQARSGGAFGL